MNIPGYMSDLEISLLQEEAGRVIPDGVIVEIGSYYGKSTVAMSMAAKPDVIIYAVDTWNNDAMGNEGQKDTYEDFLKNIAECKNIEPVRGKSADVSEGWNIPINLLFIDGDHSENGAFGDLMAWAKHVVPHGTILMHDYTEPCGVKPAWENFSKTFPKTKSTDVVGSILRVKL